MKSVKRWFAKLWWGSVDPHAPQDLINVDNDGYCLCHHVKVV